MFAATRIALQLYTKVNRVRPPLHAWLSFMLENVSWIMYHCYYCHVCLVSWILYHYCMLGIMDNILSCMLVHVS